MAAATYAVETGLTEIWRKMQAGVYQAAQFQVEEFQGLKDLTPFDVRWTRREITFEADINQAYGMAMIPEGGKEARPSNVSTSTATVTFVFGNKRFTISRTSQLIAQQQGQSGALEDQLGFCGQKALQAVRAKVGDMFWGISSGTLCLVSSVSSNDIVLKDMHAVTGQGTTTHNRRCVDLFQAGPSATAGDYIAVLNPSGPALRANGIQGITAITRSTNTITCAAASMTSPTANDLVVMANNLENTTLASGTERNQNLIGFFDGFISASVHGISSSTVPKWAPYSDTTGGQFTGIKLRKMKQAINNNGGGDMTDVWWSNGVENNVVQQLQAGLRFDDAYGMEMDGKPVSKGITFHTSRRVPDGTVWAYDKKNSVRKFVLLPDPTKPGWDDAYKLQDDSGSLFGLDWPGAMAYTNRSNLAYASGCTQS